jgi:hypothetical protein
MCSSELEHKHNIYDKIYNICDTLTFCYWMYAILCSFDFSGADKTPKNALTITDVRCMNVMFNLALVDRVEKVQGLKMLRKMDDECAAIMMGDEPYRSVNTQKRANGVRACIYKFYTRLNLREKQWKNSIKLEGLKIDFGRQVSAVDSDDEEDEALQRQRSQQSLLEVDDLSESDSSVGSNNSLGDIVEHSDDESVSSNSDSESDDDGQPVEATEGDSKDVSRAMSEGERSSVDVKKRTAVLTRNTIIKTIAPSEIQKAKNSSGGRLEYVGESTKAKPSPMKKKILAKTNAIRAIQEPSKNPTAETATLKPNPKVLESMKSSFAIDDTTGKVTRKIGAIMPTQSEKYILEFGNKFRALTEQKGINDSAKSVRVVSALEDVLGRVWMLARHVAIIMHYFRIGVAPKTNFFGTYRVELVITLYSRIVDLHNFDLVLRELTPLEVACIQCRLGLLNIYNPLKPEGYLSLDLSLHEERQVAKMIAALSVTEPGENFQNPTFRWEWELNDVPGWTLVATWMSEEGMPRRGIMLVEYYSGEGQGLKGCSPDIAFRRALLLLVS